jgi:hypothetical protein
MKISAAEFKTHCLRLLDQVSRTGDELVILKRMLGDPRLPVRERKVLDDLPSDQRPGLCDISLREFAMLVQLGTLWSV